MLQVHNYKQHVQNRQWLEETIAVRHFDLKLFSLSAFSISFSFNFFTYFPLDTKSNLLRPPSPFSDENISYLNIFSSTLSINQNLNDKLDIKRRSSLNPPSNTNTNNNNNNNNVTLSDENQIGWYYNSFILSS